jgi:hypothetical protein
LRFNEAAWPLFSLAKARDGGYFTPIWRVGITLRRYRGANRCFGTLEAADCTTPGGDAETVRKIVVDLAEQLDRGPSGDWRVNLLTRQSGSDSVCVLLTATSEEAYRQDRQHRS